MRLDGNLGRVYVFSIGSDRRLAEKKEKKEKKSDGQLDLPSEKKPRSASTDALRTSSLVGDV